MKRQLLVIMTVLASASSVGYAAGSKPTPTRIEFQAQAQRSAANDLGSATAYIELAGNSASDIAQQANVAIANALTLAKTRPSITTKTGNSRTWPVYGKSKAGGNSTTSIESWRVRSELQLETRDIAALGELLGQLQTTGLAVSGMSFAPAPETRRKVEDDTTIDAIRIFKEKATRYAAALKKPYRIRSLDINNGGAHQPMLRAAAMSAESNVVPLEAGESVIAITINGQIELIE